MLLKNQPNLPLHGILDLKNVIIEISYNGVITVMTHMDASSLCFSQEKNNITLILEMLI
jgi:hypothetical protein